MHTSCKPMALSLLAGLLAWLSSLPASAYHPETATCTSAETDVCKAAQAVKDELRPKHKKLEEEARAYCAKYANMNNYQSYGSAAAPSVCVQNYINKNNPQLDDAYREALAKRNRACGCSDN